MLEHPLGWINQPLALLQGTLLMKLKHCIMVYQCGVLDCTSADYFQLQLNLITLKLTWHVQSFAHVPSTGSHWLLHLRGWSTKPTGNEFPLQLAVLIWTGIWLSKRLFYLLVLIVQSSAVTLHMVQGNISPFSHQLCTTSHSIMPYLVAAKVISFLFLSCFWNRNLSAFWLRQMNNLL